MTVRCDSKVQFATVRCAGPKIATRHQTAPSCHGLLRMPNTKHFGPLCSCYFGMGAPRALDRKIGDHFTATTSGICLRHQEQILELIISKAQFYACDCCLSLFRWRRMPETARRGGWATILAQKLVCAPVYPSYTKALAARAPPGAPQPIGPGSR